MMAEQPRTTIGLKRITIGLRRITKAKLDRNRAPGQCYVGFICQFVDLWEKAEAGRRDYVVNPKKER